MTSVVCVIRGSRSGSFPPLTRHPLRQPVVPGRVGCAHYFFGTIRMVGTAHPTLLSHPLIMRGGVALV